MSSVVAIQAARARVPGGAFEGPPAAGAVYRVHRECGLTPVAVFTGVQTPTGRYRFEPVDRQSGESARFACKPDAVLAELAPTLADYVRAERSVRAGRSGQGGAS